MGGLLVSCHCPHSCWKSSLTDRATALQFPKALERLEELRKGGKNKAMSGKLTRDKKKDDENCVVM